MKNHAVRIAMAYDDISGVIASWSDRCVRTVVYEHPADRQVKKTHVHLALYGCEVEAEALKRMWKNRPAAAKGNKFWSWKDLENLPDDVDVRPIEKLTMSDLKYLVYCSKGKYGAKEPAAKFWKNISPAILERAKELWVLKAPNENPARSIDKAKEDLYSIVEEVEKLFDEEHVNHVVYNKTLKCHGCSCGPEGHFRMICNIVMKVLEKKRKRFNGFDFERYVYPIWTKKFEDSKNLFIDGLWKRYSLLNV